MTTLPQGLDLALAHYRQGNLPFAEQLCGQLLSADPQNSTAWLLLGLIAEAAGKFEPAADYYRRALAIMPDMVEAHVNLGNVQRKTGRLEGAIASYQEALHLNPRYAEAHNNLGNVLRLQGNLGAALASFQRAVQHKPEFAGAHDNLGLTWRAMGKLNEAVASHHQALLIDPHHAEGHHNLAIALAAQGKRDEAMASYRQAIRLKPGLAEAHNNLASLLCQQDRFAEAKAHLQEALRLYPGHAALRNRLGSVFWEEGMLAEAEACFRGALRQEPALADAHCNLGIFHLLHGDFESGWREFEWRTRMSEYRTPYPDHMLWDGRCLEGKTILLHAEQGLGDTLQFIRYAALAKKRGASVVVECHPELLQLLKGCDGIDRLVARGTDPEPFDLHASLLSLPFLFGTTAPTIPASIPYLGVDEKRIHFWRERLGGLPGVKVGICWQGNPANTNDHRRSVALKAFVPLAELPGVRLTSLQHGFGTEQLAALAGKGSVLNHFNAAIDTAQAWVESAALLCALDLVISVDTAVVHLAGALGRPVWVALPFVPDWRWLLGRETTAWYPTMRLFRQTRLNDWSEVFLRIREALRDLA
jgi:Tfp pilus assembly protein PilF